MARAARRADRSRLARGLPSRRVPTTRRLRFAYSTSRASVDLPEPDTPVTTTSRPSGMRTSTFFRLCSSTPSSFSDRVRAARRPARRGCAGCCSGSRRKRPVTDRGLRDQLVDRACADDLAAAHAGAGAEVDHVVGAADGVLVVLDDHQRVAVATPSSRERVEQDRVVARMQADGRLVEHVAHAAQVRAELRREPDALRLAARQRGRRRGRATR